MCLIVTGLYTHILIILFNFLGLYDILNTLLSPFILNCGDICYWVLYDSALTPLCEETCKYGVWHRFCRPKEPVIDFRLQHKHFVCSEEPFKIWGSYSLPVTALILRNNNLKSVPHVEILLYLNFVLLFLLSADGSCNDQLWQHLQDVGVGEFVYLRAVHMGGLLFIEIAKLHGFDEPKLQTFINRWCLLYQVVVLFWKHKRNVDIRCKLLYPLPREYVTCSWDQPLI